MGKGEQGGRDGRREVRNLKEGQEDRKSGEEKEFENILFCTKFYGTCFP